MPACMHARVQCPPPSSPLPLPLHFLQLFCFAVFTVLAIWTHRHAK